MECDECLRLRQEALLAALDYDNARTEYHRVASGDKPELPNAVSKLVESRVRREHALVLEQEHIATHNRDDAGGKKRA